jgi:hypothetical protein
MGDSISPIFDENNPFSPLSPPYRPHSPPNHTPSPEDEAIDAQIDYEMEDSTPEPTIRKQAIRAFEFSSDPISGPSQDSTQIGGSAGLAGSIHRPRSHMTPAQSRKRTRTTEPNSFFTIREEDENTPTQNTQTPDSKELILQARDLIVKASTMAKSRDE